MVIDVFRIVRHGYTWEEGRTVGKAITDALHRDGRATVSFDGIEDITTSFANGAFVNLLDDFDYDFIRSRLSIVNSTRQINDMIRRRFAHASQREASKG